MKKTYWLDGIKYTLKHGKEQSIQWYKQFDDGRFKFGGYMNLYDEPVKLTTLIRMAESNEATVAGDELYIHHPDFNLIYDSSHIKEVEAV